MASVKKLQDYIRRSSGDVINTQNAANRTGMTPAIRKHIAKRNAGQLIAQRKLSEDASSAITDGGDRRQYKSLRAMQSIHSAKAKKSKDTVAQGHNRMAQQHADAAEAILDKYRKESSDMCNVCGQTPCNCTSIDEAEKSMVPGVPNKRNTLVQRAIHRAQVVPVEKAKAKYGVGYRAEEVESVEEGANVRAGNPKAYGNDLAASQTGFNKKPRQDDEYHNDPKPKFKAKSLMDRPHDVHIDGKKWKSFNNGHQAHAAANTLQSKGKKATAIARFHEGVDESSDKLYAGYQADVLSLKAKAAAQEKKHGPVDIQKLAARLKAMNLKSQGNK